MEQQNEIQLPQIESAAGSSRLIVGIGELLWDMLPDGPQLGGAVSNFCVMAARLGDRGVIASRIGDDQLGDDALGLLKALPVDSSQIQRDASHATSTVTVSLADGQPQYAIHEPVAWDYLQLSPEWLKLAQTADAVCFGTLAQRNAYAQRTIQGFLAATKPDCMRLLDVNLREPYYSLRTLETSLASATVLKMNDGEVPQVLALLSMPHTKETTPEALVDRCACADRCLPTLTGLYHHGGQWQSYGGSVASGPPSWHPLQGSRYSRSRRYFYGCIHALLPAGCTAFCVERSRKPVGCVDGLAARRHAEA